MNNKIAQLEINSVKKNDIFHETHISQPNSKTEDVAGKLFLLINIDSKDKKLSKKISEYLLSEINKNYYNSEKIILKERISTLKVEHIFETALVKTNKNFSEHFKSINLEKLYKKLDITVGIIYKDFIHFANSGKNKIHLIHKVGENSGDEKFVITNVIKEDESNPNDNKLFSNVISGKIPEQGTFLFSSENLTEYISNSKLIKTLGTLPPASAAEQIKLTLSQINTFVSFQAILIKNDSKNISPKNKPETNNEPKNSNDDVLNSAENRTEKILNPANIPASKRLLKQKDDKNNLFIKDKIFSKKREINLIKKIRSYGISFLQVISSLVILLINTISIKSKSIDKKSLNSITKLPAINKKRGIILALVILFLIAFFSTTQLNKKANIRKEETDKYNANISLIEQKLNQAESSMLYSNDSKTKTLTQEISDLINQVKTTEDNEPDKITRFEEKLEIITNQLKKVIDIDQSTMLLNYKTANTNAEVEDISFVIDSKNIYASDSKQNSIYIYNTENNESETLLEINNNLKDLSKATILKNGNIYYLNENNVAELLVADEKINILPISLSDDYEKYSAIASYSNRIYLINQENNQIQRYTYNTNGFISPLSWLNRKIELKDAIDLDIDGYIYVLKNNGEVLKFLKGEKRDLILDSIDPELIEPSQIIVSQEYEHFYVLEPKNKRIVVYSKEGKFINQYAGELNVSKFQVDEKNKTLYFLADNKLYSTELSHY